MDFIPHFMHTCWCKKPAIGIHIRNSYSEGRPCLCEDHCNPILLRMKPNSELLETYNGKVIGRFIRFPESVPMYPEHSVFHKPRVGDHLSRYNTYTHTYSPFESSSEYDYLWLLISKYTTYSKKYDEYIEDENGFPIDICPNCGQSCRDQDISWEREPHGEYLPEFWVCSNCNSKWSF
jgi:hypothetical protein